MDRNHEKNERHEKGRDVARQSWGGRDVGTVEMAAETRCWMDVAMGNRERGENRERGRCAREERRGEGREV